MNKYLVPIGITWVFLALIIGIVLVLNAPRYNVVVEKDGVTKVEKYYINNNQAKKEKPMIGSAVAEVDIANTSGYAGEKNLDAKVEVK